MTDALKIAKMVKPVARVQLAKGGTKKANTIGSVDHPAWIPTRLGSAQDPTAADQPKISDMASLKASPNNVFGKNMALVRNYINVPQSAALRMNDDQLAEHFIEHMKDNLLSLHDQIRPDIRERSSKWYDGARAITDRQSAKYNLPDHSVAGVYAALSPQMDWFKNVSLGNRVLDIMHNHHDTPMDDNMLSKFKELITPTAKQIKDGADPSLSKYLKVVEDMHGKSMTDIDNMGLPNNERLAAKALWLRLHDETYGDKKYHIISPEGDETSYATTDDGTHKNIGWGSLNPIGKAISAIENKDNPEAISQIMGKKHKVRNFYNNILVPHSTLGDVTADTHAVAAALYRPLSGSSLEVGHNLDTSTGKGVPNAAGSDITGIRGTYPLIAEAYRRAANERGVLPRQMQSITWEAIRGLFSPSFKSNKKNVNAIDNIWRDFRAGNISQEQARALTHEAASTPQGQIPHPDWHRETGPSGGPIGPNAPSGLEGEQGNLSSPSPLGQPAGGSGSRRGRGSAQTFPPQEVEHEANGGEVKSYSDGGETEDYRGGHQAPRRNDDVGAPLHDTTGVYPADLYSPKGLHYYGDATDPIDQESYRHTVRLKGKPEAPVRVYRAIPHEPSSQEKLAKLESDMAAYQKRKKLPNDAGTTNGSQWYDNAYDLREKLRTQPNESAPSIAAINPGDWVTPSRAYAKLHGDGVLRGKYKILSKMVKAKDVFTNGDSLNEWGYDPEITKAKGGTIDREKVDYKQMPHSPIVKHVLDKISAPLPALDPHLLAAIAGRRS